MRIELTRVTAGVLDHEKIWGLVGLAVGLGVWLYPLGRVTIRCPFKMITGWPCPTCGMTRSAIQLKQFDVAGALATNPLVGLFALFAIVFCVYAWIAVLFRTRRVRIRTTRRWEPTLIRVLVVVAFLLNWAYLIWAGR
jgi:hypothetical protein